MKLQIYIANLLKDHNCVIVPEFGGFITNYKSAVIEESRKKILPPSKSVLFNPKLINNDGLLANEVVSNENKSYEEALNYIKSHVEDWRVDLKEGNRIEIGEIGFLYQQNGTINFEQNREVNLLLNAYGLGEINFVRFEQSPVEVEKRVEVEKPIRPVVKEEIKVEQTEKEEIVTEETQIEAKGKLEKDFEAEEKIEKPVEKTVHEKKKVKTTPIISIETYKKSEEEEDNDTAVVKPKRKVWKYVAVAAAIPIFFYAYWIPMETDFLDTGQIQVSDFNPIHKQYERAYDVRDDKVIEGASQASNFKTWEELTENLSANVEVYNYQFSDDIYIPVRLTTDVVVEDETVIEQDTPNQIAVSNGSYHVIAGCFSVESNADNHIKDLNSNGYSAGILDVNKGLHRVSIGGFSTKDEAKSALDDLRSKGFSGWILSE